ncbi:carbohydrate ABC transporter permease [Paenibacillus glucanolyticus]|jgi:putative aldouronate transport system permease protein|uniref:carbohydrate ABC transporter permease n=1 Tax=Paenibacillus TaxID=44249 RepID=UPI0003E1BCB7|nr:MULTISPECIES: carbohydrate ABC transporter permease [Paenibacillus]ANA78868.1 sugar ABC transporter permease [Paenibacillus glucanolyticus]AVV57216.1 carbohydrate ABC transporter permease [Paenibacillus glucanolyticus]ETT32038.1 binding-protein-dependent transport system inner membrane protein [Paenibacillus sp. FSL R5-808]MDH6670098.1 putative aldouronate transport system permease protein [Paenibacillus sp. LBL]MPY16695.1 carbohydrate ABC transporter permease [Paenibacillus glucanolyticus]
MTTKTAYETGLEKFNRTNKAVNLLFNLIFIILALLCVIPVVVVLSISFSSEDSIRETGYHLLPVALSADAYVYIVKQGTMILRALGVSALVTVAGTVLGVLLTTSMGYVLSRPTYKLRGFLTWVVFIPMVFNGGLVSSYFINTNLLGLKDSIWALILPLAVSSFNVIICKTFFKSTIPDGLIESAEIDGASQLRIFFSIIMPISLPVIATIGLFLCFSYWNDWFQSMLYIDNQNLYSLQALLNSLMSNVDALAKNAASMGVSYALLVATMPKESARMAVAILIVLPVAFAYPFFQKYFISGLTVGAVKG